jgi:hypothetical protein
MTCVADVPVAGLLLMSALGGAALAARWVWRKARPAARPVGDALVTTIEWFPADGVGRLRGIARPIGEPLIAPLSGRPCVGYEAWVVDSPREEGAESVELFREVRWAPFILDDGTGRALIDLPGGPVEYLLGVVTTESGILDDPTAEEQAMLDRHRQAASAGFNRALTYRERAIGVDELVSVRGHGSREVDPSPSSARLGRAEPPTRLRLVGVRATPLAVSTIPADLND